MLTHGFSALSLERGTTEPRRFSSPLGARGIPGRVSCRLWVRDGKGSGRTLLPSDTPRTWTGEAGARNSRESLTGARQRGRKSLTMELPEVEFEGALCAPEDGTKASERSFSGANWL